MSKLPKTVGFGVILLSAAVLINFWCYEVHQRFRIEQPGGKGPVITNLYWDFSWVGIVAAAVLTLMLIVSHVKKLDMLYETTYHLGLSLLVIWFGFALVSMEMAFVPWFGLNGLHY